MEDIMTNENIINNEKIAHDNTLFDEKLKKRLLN